LLLGFQLDHRTLAAQALRAFREAQAHQKLATLVFGPEQSVYIN
jgi:hypothetical protein